MKRLALFFSVALLVVLVAAPSAPAAFGFKDVAVVFGQEDESAAIQAGSHPFAMTTSFAVNVEVIPDGAEDPVSGNVVDAEFPEGELKDLTALQVPGFVGSQTAVPYCTESQFYDRLFGYNKCPDESAVGFAAVKAEFNTFPAGSEVFLHMPLFSLEPNPGAAATFGFIPGNVPITFDVKVSESPPLQPDRRSPRHPPGVDLLRLQNHPLGQSRRRRPRHPARQMRRLAGRAFSGA